ncbi:MAG: hypothetical protein SAJ12_11890, partial [Jaaginema sp. PMC 1079.18]|nr:hypothetical protein [Jaaginema sp. PMC 1079.18]
IYIIVFYLTLIGFYLLSSTLIDHVEPQIVSVSWLNQRGEILYHAVEAESRYNNLLYGPMLYLIVGIFLKLLSPSVFAAKLPIAIALYSSLVFLFFAFRQTVSRFWSLLAIALLCLIILATGNIVGIPLFYVRSDALIFCCISWLLWIVKKQHRPWVTVITVGLGIAIAINLKITAILYFIPILYLVYLQLNLQAIAAILGVSLIFSLLPFGLPTISWHNYLELLQLTRQHGISWSFFCQNLMMVTVLFLPMMIASFHLHQIPSDRGKHFWHKHRFYFYSLAIASLGTAIIAAKPGAGPHHLLPYLPLICDLTLRIMAQLTSSPKTLPLRQANLLLLLEIILIVFLLLKGLTNGIIWLESTQGRGEKVIRDLQEILTRYPQQTLQMGYGENNNYSSTFYRFILVFQDRPYLFDAMAVMDFQFANQPLSDRTLEYIATCQTEIWLIPQGDSPFLQPNYYPPSALLFSDSFRETFQNTYQKVDRSQFFDIWQCRPSP